MKRGYARKGTGRTRADDQGLGALIGASALRNRVAQRSLARSGAHGARLLSGRRVAMHPFARGQREKDQRNEEGRQASYDRAHR